MKPQSKSLPFALVTAKVMLRAKISSGAKAVGSVLLDHVNWKSGRCDPGIDRLVRLTGRSRSAVQAGIGQLVEDRLVRVLVHGGRSGRNSYAFNNDEIWRRDEAMQIALHSRRWPPENPSMPGPDNGAQTPSSNPLNEPVAAADSQRKSTTLNRGSGQAKQYSAASTARPSMTPSRKEAAETAAEKRWNNDLLHALGSTPVAYEDAVLRIDEHLKTAATAAEMRRHGGGLRLILQCLKSGLTGVGADAATSAPEADGSSRGPTPLAVVSDPEDGPVKPDETRVDEG